MKLLIKRVSSLEVLRNILNEKRDTRKIEFRQTVIIQRLSTKLREHGHNI